MSEAKRCEWCGVELDLSGTLDSDGFRHDTDRCRATLRTDLSAARTEAEEARRRGVEDAALAVALIAGSPQDAERFAMHIRDTCARVAPPSPAAAARLDADRTAEPKTRLVAHATYPDDGRTHTIVAGPAATLVNNETGERTSLHAETAPAAAGRQEATTDIAPLVLPVHVVEDPYTETHPPLTCILCHREADRPPVVELEVTYLALHGSSAMGLHRRCYDRAMQRSAPSPSPALPEWVGALTDAVGDVLCAEEDTDGGCIMCNGCVPEEDGEPAA